MCPENFPEDFLASCGVMYRPTSVVKFYDMLDAICVIPFNFDLRGSIHPQQYLSSVCFYFTFPHL